MPKISKTKANKIPDFPSVEILGHFGSFRNFFWSFGLVSGCFASFRVLVITLRKFIKCIMSKTTRSSFMPIRASNVWYIISKLHHQAIYHKAIDVSTYVRFYIYLYTWWTNKSSLSLVLKIHSNTPYPINYLKRV